jgi:hypothetical protein
LVGKKITILAEKNLPTWSKKTHQIGRYVRRNPVELDIFLGRLFGRRLIESVFFVGVGDSIFFRRVLVVIVVVRRVDAVAKLQLFLLASQRKIENSSDKVET